MHPIPVKDYMLYNNVILDQEQEGGISLTVAFGQHYSTTEFWEKNLNISPIASFLSFNGDE